MTSVAKSPQGQDLRRQNGSILDVGLSLIDLLQADYVFLRLFIHQKLASHLSRGPCICNQLVPDEHQVMLLTTWTDSIDVDTVGSAVQCNRLGHVDDCTF